MIRALALALVLSSCTYHVVGDSTMAAIEEVNGGHGSTAPGCGYTGYLSCVIPLTPPESDVVILAVSVWDANAPDLSAYSEAVAYYLERGAVPLVVEAPEVTAGYWTAAEIAALNDAVAVELGGSLVDQSYRVAETVDGLHHTPAGASVVAVRFQALADALRAFLDQ